MAIDHQLAKSIFVAAIACDRSAERSALVACRCRDDSELRRHVEALLDAHRHPQPLPGPDIGGGRDDRPAYESGFVIADRYTLEEEIGEGGMGTVWAAQQTKPVRRRVALKLIKPGMDSRRVMARFEIERQALALMNHVGIAKVFDGGLTVEGRPFFVMEYVQGMPLTEYCDRQRSPLAARLRLFQQVCQAIQHAHQKGIVHRDLKPSNVLVCHADDVAIAKVIDFGLAKAMHEPLTEHTLETSRAWQAGTPRYMSPEQAERQDEDADTRADVYALGVILYELLTGSTPITVEQLKSVSWRELLRLIVEEEPPRPSTRLAHSERLARIAADRDLPPERLLRQVRGDLDSIAMKALAKQRSMRYASVSELARDINRYLENQPVEARPPSTAYRFAKFARRNRVMLTTVVLVGAALVTGSVVSTSQAIRATQAERLASAARAEEARQRAFADERRREAEERRTQTENSVRKALDSTDAFFVAISKSRSWNDPALQPLRAEILGAVLNYYRDFAEHFSADTALQDPLAWAHVRVGNLISNAGSKDQAIAELRKGALMYELLARQEADVPAHRLRLTQAYALLGRVQRRAYRLTDSGASFRRSLDIAQSLADEYPDSAPFQAEVARAYTGLATVQHAADRLEDAEASLCSAIETLDKIRQKHPDSQEYQVALADARYRLGPVYRMQGRLEKAATSLRLAQATYERLPDGEQSTRQHRQGVAGAHYRLGDVQRIAGRLNDAEASYRRGLEMYEALASENPADPLLQRGVGDGHYHLALLEEMSLRSQEAQQSRDLAEASYRRAMDAGYSGEVYGELIATLALSRQWREAAEFAAKMVDESLHACRPTYQLALLNYAAGDESRYRACCADLLALHGATSNRLQSLPMVLACIVGPAAVGDPQTVVALARGAADHAPSDPLAAALVAAAEVRAAATAEAIEQLKDAVHLLAASEQSDPLNPDQLRVVRLLGEYLLALAYRDRRDATASTAQLDALSTLVDQLESSPPRYSDGLDHWALPLVLHCIRRDLAGFSTGDRP